MKVRVQLSTPACLALILILWRWEGRGFSLWPKEGPRGWFIRVPWVRQARQPLWASAALPVTGRTAQPLSMLWTVWEENELSVSHRAGMGVNLELVFHQEELSCQESVSLQACPWPLFTSICQTILQFSNTNWVSSNSIQFWHSPPGVGVRSHKLMAQSHNTPPTSDPNHKFKLSFAFLTYRL